MVFASLTIVNSAAMLNLIKHILKQGMEIQQMLIKELEQCLTAVYVWMHQWDQILLQGGHNTL